MEFVARWIMPFEDELLYSWIMRLINANGLSPTNFMTRYGQTEAEKRKRWPYDVRHLVVPICKHAYYPADILSLLLKHTSFNLNGMLLTESQQTRYVNIMTYYQGPLNRKITPSFTDVKYCPQCTKEEPIPYLHVSHNLEDVHVCHKHGCKLHVYQGVWGHELEFNPEDFQEIQFKERNDSALEYAKYVYELNKHPVNFTIKQLKTVLYNALREKGYTVTHNYETLIDNIKKWKFNELIAPSIYYFLKDKMIRAEYIHHNELIPLLMFLWPNPQDLLNHFNEEPCVVKNYVCADCGYAYVATTHSQLNGWGCPECANKISTQEWLEHIVKTTTNGEYELVDSFIAADKPVMFNHTTCKEMSPIKPREFLFDDVRCLCESRVTKSEAKARIEENGEFTLIDFKSASEGVTIQHNECGLSATYNYGHFIRNPNCKICNSMNGTKMTQELFESRVKRLVGDEYEVISYIEDKNEKALLQHKTCGHIQPFLPHRFFAGQRCEKCHKPMRNEDLNKLLQERSNGRYIITGQTNQLNDILDTQTKTKIRLSSLKIRQELFRPTKSPIFDIPTPTGHPMSITDIWEVGFNCLLQYKQEFNSVDVQKRRVYKDYNLGSWCQRQRKEFKNGILKPDRVERLQSIGFDFDPLETEWNRRYEQYKRYIEQNGSPYIPRRAMFEGENLGSWVHTQHVRYEKNTLSVSRYAMLKKIDPEKFI